MNPEFFQEKNVKKILREVGRAVGTYRMIEPHDRILVGLSGGKDSFLLTLLLHEMRRKAPFDFEIEVVTFDPGFKEFGMEGIAEYARRENWSYRVIGLPVDEILHEKEFEKNPCVLCSRLRRGHLYRLAGKLGCNKLALGHHADDAIISFLMSFFRGQGLTSMGPNVPGDDGALRIIRPLILIAESRIEALIDAMELPVSGKCKYARQLENSGDRAFFKRLLKETIEPRIPHFRSQCLQSMANLQPDYLFDPQILKKGFE